MLFQIRLYPDIDSLAITYLQILFHQHKYLAEIKSDSRVGKKLIFINRYFYHFYEKET